MSLANLASRLWAERRQAKRSADAPGHPLAQYYEGRAAAFADAATLVDDMLAALRSATPPEGVDERRLDTC